MKHNKFLFVYAFSLLSLLVGSFDKVVVNAAEKSNNWEHVHTYGANPYTLNEDNTITAKGNESHRGNFYVTDAYDALGNYSVSVDIKGSMTLPNTKEVHKGLVPWYVDENNYIVAYMQWTNNEHPNDMREIQITGKINGQNMVKWLDGFQQGEWNDIWKDQMGLPSIAAEETTNFKIERKLSEDGDSYLFYAFINNQQVGFYGLRDVCQYSAYPARTGVYGYNDEITFSNFTYTQLDSTNQYQILENDVVAKAENSVWKYENESYQLDASNSIDNFNNFVIFNNPIKEEKYKIVADVNVSNFNLSGSVGILAWYKDEYNFLTANVVTKDGSNQIGFKGKLTTLNGVTMDVDEIEQYVDYEGDISSITKLIVQKNGNTFTFIANEQSTTYSNSKMLNSSNYGLTLSGANVTYSNVNIEEIPYTPYDWYTGNLGTANKYFISSKTDDKQAVSYSAGVFSIKDAFVDTADNSKRSSFYYSSKKFDNVSTSATFSNIKGNTKYGIYGWIEDGDNYLLVEVSKQDGIVIYNHFDEYVFEQKYKLPSGISYTSGSKKLEVSITNGMVSVSWYGELITSDFEMKGYSIEKSPNIGFSIAGTGIDISKIEVTGFNPYDLVSGTNYKFKGAHFNTWEEKDNLDLQVKLNGAQKFMNTLALYDNSNLKSNFYMAGTINVSKGETNEYKTGLVPYYKDENNYVFVWMSLWQGAATCLCTTAKINGRVIGTEWKETQIPYNYFNADNQLEVQLQDNMLKIYLNRQFNPVYQVEIEGLKDRNLTNSYVGFNAFNTEATFKNVHLLTENRNYVLSEAPVITEVGSRKTSTILGKTIALPIYTATNSANDILNATVEVKDPNGDIIQLEKNRFIPNIEGNYQVTVSCVDNWGNRAEDLTYTITVTKQVVTPVEDDKENEEKPAKKGCKGQASGLGLISLLGLIIIKKKKH